MKIEAKAIHAHQLLSSTRADRGFRSFERNTADLAALHSGAADVLAGIVMRFRAGPHLKYPRQIGVHELDAFGLVDVDGETTVLVGEATLRAEEFAAEHSIGLWRRQLLELACDDWLVDVVLLWFARRPDSTF